MVREWESNGKVEKKARKMGNFCGDNIPTKEDDARMRAMHSFKKLSTCSGSDQSNLSDQEPA